MKIQPEAHNSISIILDDGATFEIRDVQDSQGFHFEIHADNKFEVKVLSLSPDATWIPKLKERWVRIN